MAFMTDFTTVEEYRSPNKSDPIVFILADPKDKTGWYFYNETWTYLHGPYVSYSEAKEELLKYADLLDNPCDPEYNDWRDRIFREAETIFDWEPGL